MKNLLLLHGAIGSEKQFDSLKSEFANDYNVFTFNFPGHGGIEIPPDGFSIDMFAKSVIDFLNANMLEKVSIFGYSMGGYVGMYLAKNFPERVEKLITLATKFHWDEATSNNEIRMLDPEKIETKIPAFASELERRHQPVDWKEVLRATGRFLVAIGKSNPLKLDDYSGITIPILILIGDRDKMVTLEETVNIFKLLPNPQFGVLPNTPHPIEQVDVNIIYMVVMKFLSCN
jgi:pimeloyl-ACP methyl ester carboxylesterase